MNDSQECAGISLYRDRMARREGANRSLRHYLYSSMSIKQSTPFKTQFDVQVLCMYD